MNDEDIKLDTPIQNLDYFIPRLVERYPNDDEIRIVSIAFEEFRSDMSRILLASALRGMK